MGARAVQKRAESKDLVDELRQELRQLLNEASLMSAIPNGNKLSQGLDFRSAVAEYERSLIEAALRISNGQKKKAARILTMSPTTLHGKIKALGIDPDSFAH